MTADITSIGTSLSNHPSVVTQWKPEPREPKTPRPLRARTKKKDAFARELDSVTPALIERAQGACELQIPDVCGNGMGVMHRHHRLRRSHGGTNDLEQLLYVDDACHAYVHTHVEEAYLAGWLIRGVR